MGYTDTRYLYLEYWQFNKTMHDKEARKMLMKQRKRGINHIRQIKGTIIVCQVDG